MKFVRDPLNEVTIRQVERGSILIGEDTYKSTVGVTVDEIVSEGLPSAIDELNAESLAPLLEAKPEMLVVGCGWASTLPPRDLTFELARRGLGMEVMDTPAACRTFNILVSEGRRPAALLIID